ncbi:uncharacterized protein LOC106094847 [Stomoxys calcitrans]|uniref:uncharacterized protein LOC106094847 n=1 Tax=Stomoxys calcitrans TaxID=35570 RepID=UPI0027E2736B|nr:uncharacterized protein LOC106094847 [Stomoxys calcitrans]
MDTIEFKRLPLNVDEIKPGDSIRYIQQLQNMELEIKHVEHIIQHIKVIIDKELHLEGQCNDDRHGVYPTHFNQITVNMCFRLYYQLLHKYNIPDKYFSPYILPKDCCEGKRQNFIVLYYVLLTAQEEVLVVEPEDTKTKCLEAFAEAVNSNDMALLDILKTLNLVYKKWPHLDVGSNFSLDHVYFCLQSNQLGMRDEMLTFLQHVCSNRETALDYFVRIVNFWPWTYRNKLYMLMSILNKNSLEYLLMKSGHSEKEFFKGLRSTLCYKNLLPSSQHVVKVLSAQRSKALIQMCAEVLVNGTLQEIKNLNAQWFSRLQQKDDLFQLIWKSMDMEQKFVTGKFYHDDEGANFRFILICSMFSKEIYQLSQKHFMSLSNELLKICWTFDLDTQLVIYKFILDNLANLNIEDCMDFFTKFSQLHMTVENAQFRNTILGKMPIIINHIAKLFCKLSKEDMLESTLAKKIVAYFSNMQNEVEEGIASSIYQPKIFSLKLLEILINSLYGEVVTKNSKNCCLKQNQVLAEFLKQHQLFDGPNVSLTLMRLLNDPTGFDDALDLTVKLLGMIKPAEETIVSQALEMSEKCCTLSDVDVANLCCLYARVAVQNENENEPIIGLFENTLGGLKSKLLPFQEDPFFACKTKGDHLFSSLNVINELVQHKAKLFLAAFPTLLQITENIEEIILQMLNFCNKHDEGKAQCAASFEDIDKSLEMLVDTSKCASNDHEHARKYLLMSFWLTLKACCELAASMGQFIVSSNTNIESRLLFLQRCIQVSENVLTKCRHKGAIEAAGVTIGQLTKCITTHVSQRNEEYELLHKCLQSLYDDSGKKDVSTTRRGAGFSIMFLHIVKNEANRSRPLLRKAMKSLLAAAPNNAHNSSSNTNCDRSEALHLHFLCVLVRDTELREAMSKYHNEIMMAAVKHIDHTEWTIRNGALQLLGALVPKIVGQRQATEFEESLLWEPSEVTFCEVTRKLDKSYAYILKYCLAEKAATGSIILFLEFLHKVEYIHKNEVIAPDSVQEFRKLIWVLLRHPCEKVRKLASKCFVRSHEFSYELPNALVQIAQILFQIKNENFFEGLVQTLHHGVLKLQHDLKYVVTDEDLDLILQQIEKTLEERFSLQHRYKFYTLCKLWDLLQLLNFDTNSSVLNELRSLTLNDNEYPFAYDLWLNRIQ